MAARDDVRRLFEQGRKQAEIASELGISPGRVSQLVKEFRAEASNTPPPPSPEKQKSNRGGPPGNKKAVGARGNRYASAPRGNQNARKTGEYSREAEFARDCEAASVDPTTVLQEQVKRQGGRLRFMYKLLLRTEQRLEDLAEAGDATALSALAVVEISRKMEARTAGEGDQQTTQLVDVELSEKSRSLLDTWHSQHEAITRVEKLLARTAEQLKPPKDTTLPPGGGIGTLIINAGIPGVDYDVPKGEGE